MEVQARVRSCTANGLRTTSSRKLRRVTPADRRRRARPALPPQPTCSVTRQGEEHAYGQRPTEANIFRYLDGLGRIRLKSDKIPMRPFAS